MRRWLLVAVPLTLAAVGTALAAWWGLFGELPPRVPVHWDIDGEPDGWAERDALLPYLLLPPGVMAILVLLGIVLPMISPRKFSTEGFQGTFDRVMLLVVALFGFIHVLLLYSYLRPTPADADEANFDLVRILLGGEMMFFGLLGNLMGKVRRNFWMGVRTPWTLASEAVWIRTHRVTAWLWTAGAPLLGVAVLAGLPIVWSLVPFVAMILYPVLYSLLLYKRLEREGKLNDGEPTEAAPAN